MLACAAEILARASQGDAGAKLEKYKAHLNSIKGSYPMKFERLNISGGIRHVPDFANGNGQPVIAVQGALSQ